MNQDELLTECTRFSTHETLDEFHGHLHWLIDQLGFKNYLYGVLPNNVGLLNGDELQLVARSNFDTGWMAYYLDKGYAQQDYLVQHCLQPDAQLCVWQDAVRHMSPTQKQIYRQAVEAGCTNALTIPMKNHIGVTGAISVTAEGSADESSRMLQSRSRALEMIAVAFNEAILDRFFGHYTHPWKPRLTHREIEVLRWLADGHTNEQIANKLLISIPTVRKHINSAKYKLGTRNSVAACVMALKWGFIH